jgi:hypothetical protein
MVHRSVHYRRICAASATVSLAVVGILAIYYLLPAGGAIPHPTEG